MKKMIPWPLLYFDLFKMNAAAKTKKKALVFKICEFNIKVLSLQNKRRLKLSFFSLVYITANGFYPIRNVVTQNIVQLKLFHMTLPLYSLYVTAVPA